MPVVGHSRSPRTSSGAARHRQRSSGISLQSRDPFSSDADTPQQWRLTRSLMLVKREGWCCTFKVVWDSQRGIHADLCDHEVWRLLPSISGAHPRGGRDHLQLPGALPVHCPVSHGQGQRLRGPFSDTLNNMIQWTVRHSCVHVERLGCSPSARVSPSCCIVLAGRVPCISCMSDITCRSSNIGQSEL